MTSTEFDCTTCGACCCGGHDRYVRLLPQDAARAIPEDATNRIDGVRFLKMEGTRCAQLLRTEDARLVCGIYADRPEACRAFRAGSFECRKARQHWGARAEALRLGMGGIAVPPAEMIPPEAGPVIPSPEC